MRKIKNINKYKLSKVIDECLSRKRDNVLKKNVTDNKSFILKEYRFFLQNARRQEFHNVNECISINNLTENDMIKLYECFRKSVKVYYDAIKLSSEHNICPYCGIRNVSEVDHYLPKSRKISLSIAPLNLVPICHECNNAKGTHYPKEKEECFIHPYFDHFIIDKSWLKADVLPGDMPSFHFYVDTFAFDINEQEIYKRIAYHFRELKLNTLYVSNAGVTLASISWRLKKERERGIEEVKKYLSEEIESFEKYDTNYWKVAMYRGLLKSDWFCDDWCGR